VKKADDALSFHSQIEKWSPKDLPGS
jgi:hypothetical protein